MSGAHSAATEPPAPKRKGKVKRKHTVGRVVLASSLVLALVTALGVVFFYRHLNGNIETESLSALGDDRPEKIYRGNGEPLNILVMGDDTRSGEGNEIDSEPAVAARTPRSSSTSPPTDAVLRDLDPARLHRPASRLRATAVPPATRSGTPPIAVGGPLCTVAQLEENADVFVDHFVVVDFNGFGEMVDAVGGVPVCVPEDIEDPEPTRSSSRRATRPC